MSAPPAKILDDELIAEVEKDMETLVTEDDEPVDNFFSDYQRRLLVNALRTSWHPVDENGAPRHYLAATDVAIYYGLRQPPIVPDMFLSLDCNAPEEFWRKGHRCYFTWEYGKAPDVVIEIVSNTDGNETGTKLRDYAVAGASYYIVFDPGRFLDDEVLRIFKRDARRYIRYHDRYFPDIGLGLTLWEGSYEEVKPTLWLRWCDEQGNLLLTGVERADLLAAKLRELGVDPDQLYPSKK